ncbi:hypothetical protein SOASR030_26450 [Leminorella grimontii]|uniref:Uncharacterized protein n=1 Tax=Leminorella grimontii TaxID=82981 RepID=A0AAV5N382_9GAMM|nr:hypothetical protein [Leminorella grimontii]KFC94789.1 hypothetical protein GLGR_2550 [Leminorella grimontii ATCC 33999 = DSM 5078]GKX56533.1 hypothetical protein SOASR030_26450 [Leminorella grimontii]GKX59867.1 hypothetical protein SOASR031_21820 [Leminorella grimontii]VFS61568.1 Uncharacterised protein [Leminorella grimontii]
MKFSTALLLPILLFLCSSAGANDAYQRDKNSYSSAEIETQTFSLEGNNSIDREILVGKVLGAVRDDRGSRVRIAWSKREAKDEADAVRQALIVSGVAPYTVTILQEKGGFSLSERASLTVTVERVRLRERNCRYNAQNYRYRDNDSLGCALNNSLRKSLVNPMEFIF